MELSDSMSDDTYPKIVIPYHISREFIIDHPQWIFIYGNDYFEKGCFGQAWVCGNLPNAFSVPTLLKICQSQSDRYFRDGDYEANIKLMDEKIALIPLNGCPIIPFPKIGQGCSQLYKDAPKLYAYLMGRIKEIAYPNIEIDYTQQ